MPKTKRIVFHPDRCKGHRECERACSMVHFRDDAGAVHSAIRIIDGSDGASATVCNQCGLCIDMCPVQALKRSAGGVVTLNTKVCVGCQSCVAFCPDGVMRKTSGRMTPFKCISCGKCVKACPEGALELAEVDIDQVAREVYSGHGGVYR